MHHWVEVIMYMYYVCIHAESSIFECYIRFNCRDAIGQRMCKSSEGNYINNNYYYYLYLPYRMLLSLSSLLSQ